VSPSGASVNVSTKPELAFETMRSFGTDSVYSWTAAAGIPRILADHVAVVPTPSSATRTSGTSVCGTASIQWAGLDRKANTFSTGALIVTLRVDFCAMVLISFSSSNQGEPGAIHASPDESAGRADGLTSGGRRRSPGALHLPGRRG